MVSTTIHKILSARIEKGYNLEYKLQGFFRHPSGFLSVLRDTEGILSGDFACAFIVGLELPNFIDVFMVDLCYEDTVKLSRLTGYLECHEGYSSLEVTSENRECGCEVC